jgi:hypothetical protein
LLCAVSASKPKPTVFRLRYADPYLQHSANGK